MESYEQWKLKLHILSPIHIGCDEVYEPTNFVIDAQNEKLIHFEPLEFIKNLSEVDKKEFSKICMSDDIPKIFRFVKEHYKKEVGGRRLDISQQLVKDYERVLSLQTSNFINEEINQFKIERIIYNPNNNLPYIPGSSIKGALRTAYLTKLAKEKNIKEYWNSLKKEGLKSGRDNYYVAKKVAKKLENELLGGSFETDPFRLVKISDFIPANDVKTKIVYAINKKKKLSKYEKRPNQILETIVQGSIFEGTITVFKPITVFKNGKRINIIEEPILLNDLLVASHNFYANILEKESNMLESIGISTLSKIRNNISKTAFIIRIGKHSGAESVTIEGNRMIKIMQGKGKPPKFLDNSTTIWLASKAKSINSGDCIPLGWAILERSN